MDFKDTKDDIFIRSALIAMIYDLNKLVKIDYKGKAVDVPFYIDLGIGSNDRFYRDFYYREEYCDCVIVHNYDKVPRFHVTPSGISLNTDQVTSPFGQAEFTETIQGKEKWTTAFVHMIPVSIDLEFKAKSSTFSEILKIWQSVMDYTIYSSIPSNFVYHGLNCESTIIIDIPSIEKTFEFSAEDVTDELMGFTFSGRLETYYPAIRDKFISGIIENFNSDIHNNLGNTTVPKNL